MAYMKAAMHKAHLIDSSSEDDDDLLEQVSFCFVLRCF
jgi:hypothetical protein